MTVPMWQVCDDDFPMHLPGERDLHELHRPGLPQDRPDLGDETQAQRYFDGLGDE